MDLDDALAADAQRAAELRARLRGELLDSPRFGWDRYGRPGMSIYADATWLLEHPPVNPDPPPPPAPSSRCIHCGAEAPRGRRCTPCHNLHKDNR